jgi:hypothetical protein
MKKKGKEIKKKEIKKKKKKKNTWLGIIFNCFF